MKAEQNKEVKNDVVETLTPQQKQSVGILIEAAKIACEKGAFFTVDEISNVCAAKNIMEELLK